MIKKMLKKLVTDNWQKLMRCYFESFLYHILYNNFYNHLVRKFNYSLVQISQIESEKKFFRVTIDRIKKILSGEKISVLDVGARGGVESDFDKYREFLNIILVEPDPKESEALAESGYKTISTLLGNFNGTNFLKVGKHLGTSS